MRSDDRKAGTVSAVILAGGRATRLGGIDKTRLLYRGEPILHRLAALLTARCEEVLVATGSRERARDLEEAGLRSIDDRPVDRGPIGGILAGLAEMSGDWALVVAGDMPLLTGDLLDRLLSARRAGDAVIVPRHAAIIEPLCALYHRRTRPDIEVLAETGSYGIRHLLRRVPARLLDFDDAESALFRSVNTAADLAELHVETSR